MIKNITVILCIFALLLTVFCVTIYADSVSCSGGIISTGDRSADVYAKCGPPDFRNSHQEEVMQRIDADTKEKVYIIMEEWTYNFGPNQLIRIVVLKNGEVSEIRTGNYGYPKP